MNKHTKSHQSQSGFTIVELMVATLVFSVILLVITSGVTQFTKNYYKGISTSNNQTVTANALNTITQALQFSAATPKSVTDYGGLGVKYFCAGSKMFVFTEGYTPSDVVGLTPPHYGLVMFSNDCGTEPSAAHPFESMTGWSTRQQLLQSNMRVTDLQVSKLPDIGGATNSYKVSLTVAYGNGDLFCRRSGGLVSQRCGSGLFGVDDQVVGDNSIIACALQSGSQFCNISQLSSAVQVRVE